MYERFITLTLLSSNAAEAWVVLRRTAAYLRGMNDKYGSMALGMAIGVAMGAAIGVGIDNVPIGIAIGIAAGAGIGAFKNGC